MTSSSRLHELVTHSFFSSPLIQGRKKAFQYVWEHYMVRRAELICSVCFLSTIRNYTIFITQLYCSFLLVLLSSYTWTLWHDKGTIIGKKVYYYGGIKFTWEYIFCIMGQLIRGGRRGRSFFFLGLTLRVFMKVLWVYYEEWYYHENMIFSMINECGSMRLVLPYGINDY